MVGSITKFCIALITAGILAGCDGGEAGNSDYFDSISSTRPAPTSQIQPLPVDQGQARGSAYLDPNEDGLGGVEPPRTGESEEITAAIAQDGESTTKPLILNEPAVAAPSADIEDDKVVREEIPVVAPVATPVKQREAGIDLNAYGRTQQQLVGEKRYNRNASKYSNGGNCGKYSVPEIAQIAFLDAGGPRRDTLLLDRDGDGFACSWVPNR